MTSDQVMYAAFLDELQKIAAAIPAPVRVLGPPGRPGILQRIKSALTPSVGSKRFRETAQQQGTLERARGRVLDYQKTAQDLNTMTPAAGLAHARDARVSQLRAARHASSSWAPDRAETRVIPPKYTPPPALVAQATQRMPAPAAVALTRTFGQRPLPAYMPPRTVAGAQAGRAIQSAARANALQRNQAKGLLEASTRTPSGQHMTVD